MTLPASAAVFTSMAPATNPATNKLVLSFENFRSCMRDTKAAGTVTRSPCHVSSTPLNRVSAVTPKMMLESDLAATTPSRTLPRGPTCFGYLLRALFGELDTDRRHERCITYRCIAVGVAATQ